jgi:hypothetical protein
MFSQKTPSWRKQGRKRRNKETKFEEDDEEDDRFDKGFNIPQSYQQPAMNKGFSESSDLFADTPTSGDKKGVKRMAEEKDFSFEGAKRFKSD